MIEVLYMRTTHSPATLAERLGVGDTSTSPYRTDVDSMDVGEEFFNFYLQALQYTTPSPAVSIGFFGSQTSTGKRSLVTPEGATPESPSAPVKKHKSLDTDAMTPSSVDRRLFATTPDCTVEEVVVPGSLGTAPTTPINQGIPFIMPNAPRAAAREQVVIPFPLFNDEVVQENNAGFVTP